MKKLLKNILGLIFLIVLIIGAILNFKNSGFYLYVICIVLYIVFDLIFDLKMTTYMNKNIKKMKKETILFKIFKFFHREKIQEKLINELLDKYPDLIKKAYLKNGKPGIIDYSVVNYLELLCLKKLRTNGLLYEDDDMRHGDKMRVNEFLHSRLRKDFMIKAIQPMNKPINKPKNKPKNTQRITKKVISKTKNI